MESPFISLKPAKNSGINNTLPLFTEWAYDYVHDTLRKNSSGVNYLVYGDEALKVWIYKALKTERGRYSAYRHGDYDIDSDFGVELERFIGRYPNNDITAAKIKSYIEQGLLVNPYITSIDNISVKLQANNTLTIALEFTSVYGSDSMEIIV